MTIHDSRDRDSLHRCGAGVLGLLPGGRPGRPEEWLEMSDKNPLDTVFVTVV